ncbi:hypothetical protein MesoLjLb_73980 [Mesorhizobium sp. L-8-3]|nr:hypothetical protein MesoLjLb_73980 [Mesorhizobium sp. L-8-3]
MVESDGEVRTFGYANWMLAACILILGWIPICAIAQEGVESGEFVAILTDSPRDTIAAFDRLSREFEDAFEAYLEKRDIEHAARVELLAEQVESLIDLSAVPQASRRKVGGETAAYLLDIFGRIGFPKAEAAPDVDTGNYAIRGTPFRVVRVKDGERQGEFLFSRETIRLAPRFLRVVGNTPLRSGLPIDSWSDELRLVTGPMIPAALVESIPDSLKRTALGVPIWKAVAVVVCSIVAGILLFALHRLLRRAGGRAGWTAILTPLAIVFVVALLQRFFAFQINITGDFSQYVDVVRVAILHVASAWALWLLCVVAVEATVGGSGLSGRGIDASLLRLVARIVGVVGGIVILAHGAQMLGLPVYSIVAGLGIGGLAVALAVRPTLENLISGFILYLDRPIRVGDFCTFGDQSGTVESIGVRSTQIRALDRTRISIPNSQFADMQIINWAHCDQMMVRHVIGLRYETESDQLRYVLAKIREMLHGHPRIDDETIRVRLVEFADSSLNIEIRVYARTREWNDYYAIREDLLLRIKEIVETSGTGFAFPSQTLYLGRDEGLDAGLGEKSRRAVAEWRRKGRLPFPQFHPEMAKQLSDRLDYPPRGSPDYQLGADEMTEQKEERLSSPAEEDAGEKDQPR